MADSVGTLAKAAFRKADGLSPITSYPDTPGGADLGAGDQIPFTQESFTQSLTRSKDPSLVGAQAQPAAPVIARPTGGALSGRARWRGFERLWMLALGFELPNGSDGSPYLIGTGEGTKVVTGATNATPIVVSVSSHGYSNGDGVQIASVGGNAAANGDWAIANVTAGTFELVDSSGNGAYTSGGTAEKHTAAAHIFEGDDTIQDEFWGAKDSRDAGFSPSDAKVRRGQVAFSKQVSDWVFSDVFINKITLAGNPQEVTLTVDFFAYDVARGSYNSGSWTLPAGSEAQIIFSQLECYLIARTAGEAGMVTPFRINSFEISVDNKLKVDDQTAESGVYFEQPVRDGFRETKLKIELPRYADDLFFTLGDIDTEYCGKLLFTGPTIAGGSAESYLWGFFFSSLRFDQFNSNISGPGRLPQSVEFFAERPGGTDEFKALNYPTMTLVKDSEIIVKLQNEDPQNYLTEAGF